MNNHLKMWPGYIPPYKDELLSSWLFRNILEHKIKCHSFTEYYFHTPNIWNRDIDKFLNDVIIKSIEEQTPLMQIDIEKMQLSSYRNTLFVGDLNLAYSKGINNIGIYHRKRTKFGLLYCPSVSSPIFSTVKN